MNLRVELTIDGGFAYLPGLAKPLAVEDTQLAADDARQLERLCAALIANPSRTARPKAPSPDARRYRLVVESGGKRRQIEAADPVLDETIAELIAFVRERGKRD